jgi:hypothetical protein
LAIAAIQNKVLSGKRKAVSIRPTHRDTLITGDSDGSAATEFAFFRWITSERGRIRIGIEHAKSPLCRPPNLAGPWVNELVQRIVAEMIVMMTRRELEETIVCRNVFIRIPDEDIAISDVRRHYRKTHKSP